MTTVGKIVKMLSTLHQDAIVEKFEMQIKGITHGQADFACNVHNAKEYKP